MVDNASPPTTAELQHFHATDVVAIAVYVGGPNSAGDAWEPKHAAAMRDQFRYVLPIYVGEFAGESGTRAVTLTRGQGERHAADAVSCARRFGFTSGPLCLDIEANTWLGHVAPVLDYAEAWAMAVEDAGYRPVLYAPLEAATDYVPRPGHRVGIWVALWDDTGDLSRIPHRERFAGLGWQYEGRTTWDYSNVDGGWWTSPAPSTTIDPHDLHTIATNAIKVPTPLGEMWVPHVFDDFAVATYPNPTAALGYPLAGAFIASNDLLVQWFERGRLEWHPEANPPCVMAGRVGAELWQLVRDALAHAGKP